MEKNQFYKIFKSKREAEALPDISQYTDDIMGANMSIPVDDVPSELRMIQRRRAVAPFMDPITSAENEEYEEENEEGDVDSEKEDTVLSNREQGFQHGFNPRATQRAKKWEQFKDVSVDSIPRIVTAGIESRSHITPKFNQVKDLPVDIKGPVMALSKHVFDQITNTSTEDIQVIVHAGGRSSPNSADEVHAVEEWLDHHGHEDSTAIEPLRKKIHGIKLMHSEGITHLLVDNSTGRFIFSWPSTDNHIIK